MQKQHLRLAAAASLLYAAAGCGMSQLPAAPRAGELEIRGTTLLMLGGRGRLTAWQARSGELREVRATWTVEGDAVSVTSGGVVVARALGPAIVRAHYDDFLGVTTVHVVDASRARGAARSPWWIAGRVSRPLRIRAARGSA